VSTTFVSQNIWPRLSKEARESRQRCVVAVAYLGAGASRLLPLPKGSRLVVDASEGSVASGKTCPADLIKLTKRGVMVYSVSNLHAKVFVFGRATYVGSSNVSQHSASQLVEAMLYTTDPKAVQAARKFVSDHCLHELTPEVLKQLSKLYHPPLIPGGEQGKLHQAISSKRPSLPRLLLAQLHYEDWSKRDQSLHDVAMRVAKRCRAHPRSFELESFRQTGKCNYQCGDVVIQVMDEGGGSALVSPPGTVLHVRTRRDGSRQVSFVYLERPSRRRRQVKSLAHALGCTQKRLRRNGVIRDAAFAQALMKTWAVD